MSKKSSKPAHSSKKKAPEASDNWNDSRCILSKETKPDGQLVFAGTYYIGDIPFIVSLRQQKNLALSKEASSPVYDKVLRGQIAVQSIRDGYRLQASGPDRTRLLQSVSEISPGSHPEETKVWKPLYCSGSMTTKHVKEAIAKKCSKIYREFFTSIEADQRTVAVSQLQPIKAVIQYGRACFTSGKRVPKQDTVNRKLHKLTRLAAALEGENMESVTVSTLEAVYPKLGSSADDIFKLGYQFWEYCQSRSMISKNPFVDYYTLHSASTKTPEKALNRALTPRSLPDSVDQLLDERICSADPLDPGPTALLLCKHLGLNVPQMLELSWSNFVFDSPVPGAAQLLFRIDDIAGATHDFSHPVAAFPAAELRRRHQAYLKSKSGAQFVLQALPNPQERSSSGKKRAPAQPSSAFLRNHILKALKDSGMGQDSLTMDRQTLYGVGVSTLQAHYRYHLIHQCGLDRDSGLFRFLALRSVASDVTSDHYRSFTSPDGQRHLLNALARLSPSSATQDSAIHSSEQDGITTTVIPPAATNRTFEVEVTVTLHPGDWLEMHGEGLMDCTALTEPLDTL